MALEIPEYFVAQQVSVMAVSTIVSEGGVLSIDDNFDLIPYGVFDRLDFESDRGLREVSSSDAQIENYQPTKGTFTATLSALDLSGKNQILMDIYANYDYVRVAGAATRPGESAPDNILVVIAAIDRVTTGFVEDRNATQLILRPCSILPYWGPYPSPI